MLPSRAGHLGMLGFSLLVAESLALGALATTGAPRSAAQAPWRYFVLVGVGLTCVALVMLLKD